MDHTFEQDLAELINRHSCENASNTPDFVLAQFMVACVSAFNASTQQRETWYGRDPRPSFTAQGSANTAAPSPAPDHSRQALEVLQEMLDSHNDENPWLGVCAAVALLKSRVADLGKL